MMSPRSRSSAEVSTTSRSSTSARQPSMGFPQWIVGSIDEEGIRYVFSLLPPVEQPPQARSSAPDDRSRRSRTEKLFAGELEPEQRERRDQHDDPGGDPDHEPRPPAALQRLPADLRPEHDQARRGAERDDDHGSQNGGALERDLEQPDHEQHERSGDETGRQCRLGAHASQSSGVDILRPWTLRTTTRPAMISSSSSSASASASTQPISPSGSARPRSGSASSTTTSSTRRRPRTSS